MGWGGRRKQPNKEKNYTVVVSKQTLIKASKSAEQSQAEWCSCIWRWEKCLQCSLLFWFWWCMNVAIPLSQPLLGTLYPLHLLKVLVFRLVCNRLMSVMQSLLRNLKNKHDFQFEAVFMDCCDDRRVCLYEKHLEEKISLKSVY